MNAQFVRAVKEQSKLRLALDGPPGAGKTWTSLTLATHLGGPIAMIDTEHGSASKYADTFTFDTLQMEKPYHPDRMVDGIHTAQANGYNVVIVDSMSHFWNGAGGMLDIVDQISMRSGGRHNNIFAWREATPIYHRMIEGMLESRIHIIGTMRSKIAYSMEQDDKGKVQPKKVGLQPIQRNDIEFEFDVAISMDVDNNAIVTKTRCQALAGMVFRKPGKELADHLRTWLDGAPPAAIEVVNVLDQRSVEYAAKVWAVDLEGAGERIRQGVNDGTLPNPAMKPAFVNWIKAVRG